MLLDPLPSGLPRPRTNVRRLAVIAAAYLCLAVCGAALAQNAPPPPPPPPWNPGGGTVDTKDPNLWHNPKDGPSDYVWNPKICRWVYKDNGKDAFGTHKAGQVASQGPPVGVPPGSGKMTGPGTAKDGNGNTYTWDDDTTDAKGKVTPGKGWVNDKTGTSLCTPPNAAAAIPGATPAPGTVPAEVAPEHTSVPPQPGAATGYAVNYAPVPATPTLGQAYYNTPFYNTPYYNTPYYNSPLEAAFYNSPFYNTPFDYYAENGFYIGPKAGATWLPESSGRWTYYDGGGSPSDTDYSAGYDVGLRAGEKLGPWRFEGEFNYRYNGVRAVSFGTDPAASGHTRAITVLANAIYDFPLPLLGGITPHIGGGIGLANLATKQQISGVTLFDSNDTQFAYQAIGGLRVPLAPHWSMDVDYRYLATADPTYKDSFGNKINLPYASHTLLFSLTYLFGGPPPRPGAPPPAPAPARSEATPPLQVASLAPAASDAAGSAPATVQATQPARLVAARTDEATAAPQRFTIRFDDRLPALTPSGIRSFGEAVGAIRAGRSVQIAIDGCGADADFADGSPCARRTASLKQLLARHGVGEPSRFLGGA